MAITIRFAATGEILDTKAYNAVDELRVCELRLQFCQALKTTDFFAWTLFHECGLADDAARVSNYPPNHVKRLSSFTL